MLVDVVLIVVNALVLPRLFIAELDFLGFSETQFAVSANRFVHLELTRALPADQLLLRVEHLENSR